MSGPLYWKPKLKISNENLKKPENSEYSPYDGEIFYLKSREFYGKGKYDGYKFTLF